MVAPSPTFQSLSTSCLAASPQGGTREYLTRGRGQGERDYSSGSPQTRISWGKPNRFSPAEVGQWAQGNEFWGLGAPETPLVILNPS